MSDDKQARVGGVWRHSGDGRGLGGGAETPINPAPSYELLDIFMGTMDIKEFQCVWRSGGRRPSPPVFPPRARAGMEPQGGCVGGRSGETRFLVRNV
jgi:hypothetical protein